MTATDSRQTYRVHRCVPPGDIRIMAYLVGAMSNRIARRLEGDEYEPMPRPQLRGGDAASKVEAIRHLSEELEYIADAIEDEELQ